MENCTNNGFVLFLNAHDVVSLTLIFAGLVATWYLIKILRRLHRLMEKLENSTHNPPWLAQAVAGITTAWLANRKANES